MENFSIPEPSGQDSEQFKFFLRDLYPTAEAFEKYATPYLTYFPVRSDYEKYITILITKLDVDGLKGLTKKMAVMGDIAIEGSANMLNGVIEIFNRKYGNGQPFPKSMSQFIQEFTKELSVDKLPLMQGELNEALYKEYAEGFEKMDEKAKALDEEEKDIYEYFSVLISRLWMRMILTNPNYPPEMNVFLKSYLIRYYQGMQHLYDKSVPQELIDYIKNIEIPNEEQLRLEINNEVAEKNILPPAKTMPQFHQIEEIYNVLHRYFDSSQHQALRNVLQGQSGEGRLFFKGHQNQLADAFKRLLKAVLLTGCNKEELIIWISGNFEYKSERNGAKVLCSPDYLRDIVSTDQKPCKKPIISIEKDGEGKIRIFSPDRQDRKQP